MCVNQERSEVIILKVLDCQLKSVSPLFRDENQNWTRNVVVARRCCGLQAGHSSLQRRDAAAICKFGLEIKNRCTKLLLPNISFTFGCIGQMVVYQTSNIKLTRNLRKLLYIFCGGNPSIFNTLDNCSSASSFGLVRLNCIILCEKYRVCVSFFS